MSNITDDELLNATLLDQVENVEKMNAPKDELPADSNMAEIHPEPQITQSQPEAAPVVEEIKPEQQNEAAKYIGQHLSHRNGNNKEDKERNQKMIDDHHLTRIGQKIETSAEFREGWIEVNKSLLGDRAVFYPESWQFRIRPATVDAIRHWSTIDDENPNSVDDVFNEIIKSCLSIVTPTGPIPVGNICSWDRFFFLLLIREYTFTQGEVKIQYDEDCIECDNPVTFVLSSNTLMYDMPDPEVMPNYDQETRSWYIDPEEYEVEGQSPIKLYVPTIEKDANIKEWVISRLQENRNRKPDQVFIKFLMWLAPKISKDATIAKKQIREYEMVYKSWDTEMFSFMDDVVRNIIVTPSQKLTAVCPVCGEEMTSDIRFPNNIRSLFNVQNRFKKFGKK